MERWWRLWRQPETAKRCDRDGVRPRLIAQAKRGTPILCFCSALLRSVLFWSAGGGGGVQGGSERRRRRWTWVGGWWSIPCTSTPRKRSPKVVGYLPARPVKTLPWWRSATAANTWSSPVPLRCVCISLCLSVSLSLVQSLLQFSASDSSACDKGLHFLLFHPVSSLDSSACNKGLHFLLLHPVSALDSSTCDNKGFHFLLLLHLESAGLLWFLGIEGF